MGSAPRTRVLPGRMRGPRAALPGPHPSGQPLRAPRRPRVAAPPAPLPPPTLEPSVEARLVVERGARIGRGQRDLYGVGIDLAGKANRLLNGLARLPRQSEDERAVYDDPQVLAVPGESPGDIKPHALLD